MLYISTMYDDMLYISIMYDDMLYISTYMTIYCSCTVVRRTFSKTYCHLHSTAIDGVL